MPDERTRRPALDADPRASGRDAPARTGRPALDAGPRAGGRDAPARCAHCGLPAGRAPVVDEPAFCCVGCRLAASVGAGRGHGVLEARLLLAAFLSMAIMTGSLVLYGEALLASGDEPGLAAVRNVVRAGLALVSLPVLGLLGVPLFVGAWRDLRRGRLHMDGLIVLAIVAAYALSLANTWRGAGEVYFETATMVLVLVTFGRRLEARARARGGDTAALLAELLPERALRVAAAAAGGAVTRGAPTGGMPAPVREAVARSSISSCSDGSTGMPAPAREAVAPEALVVGDVVEVAPGERVPTDGVVVDGRSEVVAAMVTGEQAPVEVAAGARLTAGSVNGSGALRVRVGARIEEGSLARLRALLEGDLTRGARVRLADRLAGWLALAAVALAAVAAGLGARDGAGPAVTHALSVLLVACPCALGLATPLAYRSTRTALARTGVLVLDAAALERAPRVDHVLLDKTGTLTEPLGRLEPTAGSDVDGWRRASALVASSGHALARAAAPLAQTARVADARLVAGRGVSGVVDGVEVHAGSPAWLDELGAAWPPELERARSARDDEDATLVASAEAGRVVALGVLRQGLRPGAAAAVEALRADGVDVEILSGDRPSVVARLAAELGVPACGGLRPDEKMARLQALRARGRVVLMAGDGVNDAPALREADVGVAMVEGTAAARAHADVEIRGDDLRALPRLLVEARRLRGVAVGNLAWTLAYNGVALGLAVTGRLHPLVAACAMIASSAVVSVRSARLLDVDPGGAAPGALQPARAAGPAPTARTETPTATPALTGPSGTTP